MCTCEHIQPHCISLQTMLSNVQPSTPTSHRALSCASHLSLRLLLSWPPRRGGSSCSLAIHSMCSLVHLNYVQTMTSTHLASVSEPAAFIMHSMLSLVHYSMLTNMRPSTAASHLASPIEQTMHPILQKCHTIFQMRLVACNLSCLRHREPSSLAIDNMWQMHTMLTSVRTVNTKSLSLKGASIHTVVSIDSASHLVDQKHSPCRLPRVLRSRRLGIHTTTCTLSCMTLDPQ